VKDLTCPLHGTSLIKRALALRRRPPPPRPSRDSGAAVRAARGSIKTVRAAAVFHASRKEGEQQERERKPHVRLFIIIVRATDKTRRNPPCLFRWKKKVNEKQNADRPSLRPTPVEGVLRLDRKMFVFTAEPTNGFRARR